MKILSFSLVAAMLWVSGAAWAERGDREKPINIESDRVTVDEAKEISVFDGSVVFTQGTLTIRGDRLEVRRDKEGFKQGTVWGKRAQFRQKRDGVNEWTEGWGERIEYDSRADKVQLFTAAQLKRGADEVAGDYISYDADTEFFQVIGGGSKAATNNNPNGRVRTVLNPAGAKPAPAGASNKPAPAGASDKPAPAGAAGKPAPATPGKPAPASPTGKPVPLRQVDSITAPRDDAGAR